MTLYLYHGWFLGHSMEVRKFVTELSKEANRKGWLIKCSCGKEWSR